MAGVGPPPWLVPGSLSDVPGPAKKKKKKKKDTNSLVVSFVGRTKIVGMLRFM